MTRAVISSIALPLVFAWMLAAGPKTHFQASSAQTYAHQKAGAVTVGAQVFDKPEMVEEAFGKKTDLLRYGVLPVLVVIDNKGQTPLDLSKLEVNLVASDGRHANPVSPNDLYALAKRKPKTSVTPYPPIPLPSKKNPLDTPELQERAFAARVIAPNDSASGFFYFEARAEPDDKLYLNGIRDARSGQELLYFEFPVKQ